MINLARALDDERLIEKIEKLEEENKNLNKQIEQFKKGVKAGTKIIEKLEEENKNLTEKIRHLEFDIDAWKQLKLVMEGKIEKLNEELDGYKM